MPRCEDLSSADLLVEYDDNGEISSIRERCGKTLGFVLSKKDVTGGIGISANGKTILTGTMRYYDNPVTPTVILESFQNLADFSLTNSGSAIAVAQSSLAPAIGGGAIRMTCNVSATTNAAITQDQYIDLSARNGFWLVTNNQWAQTAGTTGMSLYLSTAAALGAGTGRFTCSGNTAMGLNPSLGATWIPKTAWGTLDGSPSFTVPMLSYRVRMDSSTSGEPHDWILEGIVVPQTRPKLILSFDDGWTSSYTIGHAEARKRDIPLSHYLIASLLGQTNYITLAQAQSMKAEGDYLGLHGVNNWGDDPARIAIDATAIKALGIDTNHAAYPQGNYGTGVSWQATQAALNAAGVKTARTVNAGYNLPKYQDLQFMNAYPLNNATNLSAAKGYVDQAILSGGTLCLYGHQIGATADSLTWVTADYQALLDYICSKRDSGSIDVMTIEQWYNGLL